MKYPKRSQYKHARSQYRVRNWPECEEGLQKRGDLTVWLSNAALDAWRAPPGGRPGGQRTYWDLAIEAPLTVRMVFRLPLRQTEGFLRSLASLRRSRWSLRCRFGLRGCSRERRGVSGDGADPAGQRERNRRIRSMRKLGRREWFANSGYSRRSLVEHAVFRYKTILGQRMRSRSLNNQHGEVRLASKILNTMTRLGRPDSVEVE